MSDELTPDTIIKLADVLEKLLLAATPDDGDSRDIPLTEEEHEAFEAVRELKRRAIAKKGGAA